MRDERVTSSGRTSDASATRRWPTTPARRRAPSSSIHPTLSTPAWRRLRATATELASAARASAWAGTDGYPQGRNGRTGISPPEMIARQPYLPRFMAGGPGNPLGARAMYSGNTVYRIHGTDAPIGTRVSSGRIPHQRERGRPVQSCLDRRQGRRAADERPAIVRAMRRTRSACFDTGAAPARIIDYDFEHRGWLPMCRIPIVRCWPTVPSASRWTYRRVVD